MKHRRIMRRAYGPGDVTRDSMTSWRRDDDSVLVAVSVVSAAETGKQRPSGAEVPVTDRGAVELVVEPRSSRAACWSGNA